jgi:hypothetical protein
MKALPTARPTTTRWPNAASKFTRPPAERPYGIEAIMRDDSGNWYSFTQAHHLSSGAEERR